MSESESIKDLEEKNRRLEAHVKQLQNVIAKMQSEAKREHQTKKSKPQRPFDFTKYNTRHVALKFAYLGEDYHGFAVQEDTDKTIEHALFDALKKTRLIESRETSHYHRCGRTDKGVSAFSQVVSIDLRSNLLEGTGVTVREGGTAHLRQGGSTEELRYVHILNKVLPAEIRVLAWCPVQPNFSARFSCLQRTYKYFFPRGDLDLEAMRAAGRRLEGEHDYRNLCKMDVGNGVVNFSRCILSLDIREIEEARAGGYGMCVLTVLGQAFLWHQIRCIVAVLFLIGQGKESVEVIEELMDVELNPRKPQYTMASELPLVLYECDFANVDWIYEEEEVDDDITQLQTMWTRSAVRTTMLRSMLGDLEKRRSDGAAICTQVDSLLPGNKPRVYRPLMLRDKCESLEDRIEHYAKRRRIEAAAADSKPPEVKIEAAEVKIEAAEVKIEAAEVKIEVEDSTKMDTEPSGIKEEI